MTLVLALHGQESIWLCADRRLTYPGDRFVDSACKILSLEGTNGCALLGYAGLGASCSGTQPSDWMNDLLANRPIGTLESYLDVLASAMQQDMPPHLATLPIRSHQLIAPAIIDNETRLYAITLDLGHAQPPHFIYTRFALNPDGGPPPHLAIAGSGVPHVPNAQKLARELRKMVRAVEKGRANPLVVTDRLAQVNHCVSQRESSVSGQCMVVWRHKGGSYQFYDGTAKVPSDLTIPTVVNGMDLRHIMTASMPFSLKNHEEMRRGEAPANYGAEIQAAFEKLSKTPKRKL